MWAIFGDGMGRSCFSNKLNYCCCDECALFYNTYLTSYMIAKIFGGNVRRKNLRSISLLERGLLAMLCVDFLGKYAICKSSLPMNGNVSIVVITANTTRQIECKASDLLHRR